jgi:palmitoyltransferase
MDGMTISLLPLSALFTLLTAVLTGSHTWMLLHNVTTLEQMRAQDWHEAEEAALSARFRWYELGKKEAVRKRWRREWGTVYVEGNRWFVGYRRNWQGTMGARKLLWLLPLGRPVDDGIGFPVNPRVGADGGWRKRELWPTELQ